MLDDWCSRARGPACSAKDEVEPPQWLTASAIWSARACGAADDSDDSMFDSFCEMKIVPSEARPRLARRSCAPSGGLGDLPVAGAREARLTASVEAGQASVPCPRRSSRSSTALFQVEVGQLLRQARIQLRR